jgi:chondroitin AC lyase
LQKGNWGKINASSSNEEISGQVFKMWINHGSNITNGTYAYVTVPSILPDEMKNYRSDEVIVLSNTDSIQAVEHTGLKMTGIVFYKPGMISTKDIIVSVDKPCILLIKENNDIISLSIADPLQKGKEVEVFLKTQKGVKKQICPLPDGNFAGASAHFKINF